MPPDTKAEVEIEGRKLILSNLAKPLYPGGFTKAEVIDYYAKIGPVLLPHLRDRAITLKRYPHGTGGPFFYEKRCPPFRPSWVSLSKSHLREDKTALRYCVVNDLPTLVWIANLASIELHVLLSRADAGQPTMAVFDLDPGPGAAIADCAWAALELKRILKKMRLEAYPKASGGKGVHLAVPFNTPTDFDATKKFARGVASLFEKEFPDRVTSNMRKDLRKGRIFVDWSQNSETKTTACVYSLRAKEEPSVAAPVTWEEIERASKKKADLRFSPADTLKRVKKWGDLHEPVLTKKQKVPAL